jgi:acetylornithine deacetylase/succinyl-diaminopimelate desuccinylase-like protein
MKGQLLACILAIEAVLAEGTYPATLKILLEGNEEFGPSPVGEFIRAHQELLRCDYCFSPDAGMIGEGSPTITYGMRGRSNCVVRVSGPSRDVHDGVFGGVVLNPIHVLGQLIAGLHDSDGRVAIPGFYDKVRAISDTEKKDLARLPKDDGYFLENSGVPSLWGETEYPSVERTSTRPSLNILQVRAGGPSSAIPSFAEAEVTARLVPDQDPAEMGEQLARYVRAKAPAAVTCDVRFLSGYRPVLISRTSPGIVALGRALEETWGRKPLFDRSGAGIPVVARLQDILGVDSVLTGFSLPADNIHGPNESVHLPTLRRGAEAMVRFLLQLSESPPGPLT